MKKILVFLLFLTGVVLAQEDYVPYFQGPYFERFYSPIDYSELATLEVTLAIREVVQLIPQVEPTAERPAFTFVSRQSVTNEAHDLLERMFFSTWWPA